jgi:hypothetical protein
MNTLLKIATVGALATLAACSSHRVTREVVREQPIVQQAAPTERVVVQQAAPAERVVIVQQPAAPVETIPPAPSTTGYSWVAGYYEFRDGTWAWKPGQWVAGTVRPAPALVQETTPAQPHAGARWVPGYWSFAGNDWVWVRGRWL